MAATGGSASTFSYWQDKQAFRVPIALFEYQVLRTKIANEASWELLTEKKKKKKSQAAFKPQRALREFFFMKYIIFITKLHKWP